MLWCTAGLQNLFNHSNTFLLQNLTNRITELLGVWPLHTNLVDNTIENQLRSDAARNADGKSHCGVTDWITISLQGRGDNVLHSGISVISLTMGEGTTRTVFPPCHSTTNLCCSITRSRSPTSYFIRPSSRAHNVSRRFPALGCTFSEEKSPIHRKPEMIRLASNSSGNLATSLMHATRSLGIRKFQSKRTRMPNTRFRSRGGTNSLLGNFSPGQVASQPLLDGGIEPTEVNKSLDK